MKVYKSFVAELNISYKKNTSIKNTQITSSEGASQYIKELWPVEIEHREACMALYLNRANNTIGYAIIGIGGLSGTVVDPKIIFQNALLCNASALILSHNHPSGNLNPSEADKSITKKISNAGKVLEINVLDHVIITKNSYFSFADEGIMQ